LRNGDIADRTLTVNRSINHFGEKTEGKTENAQRTFVLSRLALRTLAAQRAMLKDHGIISPWVFPDENGERLDSNHLFRKWSTYRDQHGIQTGLHELRHTWISVMKNDATEQQIKRAVGHAPDMDTFGTYGHDVDGDLEEIADAVDRAFSRLRQPASASQESEKT
jgi:integrase